jgi:hypothetical protein
VLKVSGAVESVSAGSSSSEPELRLVCYEYERGGDGKPLVRPGNHVFLTGISWVYCKFEHGGDLERLRPGQRVTVKGKCQGRGFLGGSLSYCVLLP